MTRETPLHHYAPSTGRAGRQYQGVLSMSRMDAIQRLRREVLAAVPRHFAPGQPPGAAETLSPASDRFLIAVKRNDGGVTIDLTDRAAAASFTLSIFDTTDARMIAGAFAAFADALDVARAEYAKANPITRETPR